MPTHPTVLSVEGEKTVVSPVPSLASTLDVVSSVTLDLKGEECAEMVSPVALDVVVPIALNLKGKGMVTELAKLEGADAAAFPTTTNILNPTNPTTNMGKDSPKTSTRPTKTNETNAAEMPPRPDLTVGMPPRPDLRAEESTRTVLPPTPSLTCTVSSA